MDIIGIFLIITFIWILSLYSLYTEKREYYTFKEAPLSCKIRDIFIIVWTIILTTATIFKLNWSHYLHNAYY